MPAGGHNLVVWSYAVAAALYALLAMRILITRDRASRSLALTLAASTTAAWALITAVALALASRPILMVSVVADVLSYGAWYVFLLALLRRPREGNADLGSSWLPPIAITVV